MQVYEQSYNACT